MNVHIARFAMVFGSLVLGFDLGAPVQAGSGAGAAFGISVNALGVQVARTPYVELPPSGSRDAITDDLVNLDTGVASSTTLFVSTQGRITGNNGTITSSAEVEDLDILDGLVTADLVMARSSSGEHTDQGNQNSARLSSGGSFFTGLIVAGVAIENEPPPNTVLPIDGVGFVILNEQIVTGDNRTNSSLTVYAIHVILMDGLVPVGEIFVSGAHSGVDYRR